MRSHELVNSLENLTQEKGFPYTFSYLVLSALWTTKDETADTDWNTRPNHKELTLLLGLMVKHHLRLNHLPNRQLVDAQIARASSLFAKLQAEHLFFSPSLPNVTRTDDSTTLHEKLEAYDQWMSSGKGMIEPIFYGGSGASDFQYLDLAEKRYSQDQHWFRTHLDLSIEEITMIAARLKHLTHEQVNPMPTTSSFHNLLHHCFTALTFDVHDLSDIQQSILTRFLELFSLTPGEAHAELRMIADYNTAHSKPLVRLPCGRYFLPIYNNLTESIYESPYYWMLKDDSYSAAALTNRGNATERIAHDFLQTVFGQANVYRGVKVRHQNKDLTDIEVLGVAGTKAVILQAKSKKLTIPSRQGDRQSLASDFHEAIQRAYDQGLVARKALIQNTGVLTSGSNHPVRQDQPIDEVYILCVTGDHYPAIPTQLGRLLVKSEADPHPIVMSIFDLEVVAHYLNDAVDFLYYLRQRSVYSSYFWTDSELALLGFHLSNKLFPHEQAEGIYINSDFAQLVDVNFRVAKGPWPTTEAPGRLYHQWRNSAFETFIHDVKSSRHTYRVDALFLLFDLAGDAADNIIRMVDETKLKTRSDGQMRDVSFPISGHKTGVTFVCFAPPLMRGREEELEQQFHLLTLARKHKSRGDEWLGLASFAGSSKAFDMIWYSKEPWKPDSELDDLVRLMLKPGTFLKADGRKVGRNDPCPCGSGMKFKRCHDRLRFN